MEYKQMLFDACSSHSEPRLLQLAALKDPEISKSIAQNVFITEAVAVEIFAEYPYELLGNPSFTRLGKLNPQFMQDIFARHYRVVLNLILPVTWFRYLLSHPSSDVRRAVASNSNLPKQFYEQCVTSQDTALRMGIANNCSLPYGLLKHLRSDPDPQIKAIATQNPGNFSLTIKLPVPASAIKTPIENSFVSGDILVSTDKNIANGKGKDFAEPSTTAIQVFDTPSATALTRLQTSNFHWSSRSLPLLIIAALSLLSLGLLATLWSLLGQRDSIAPAVNLQASSAIRPLAASTSEDLVKMNQAIKIANSASLAAKQFPDRQGWEAISGQWTEAIAILNKIPNNSKIHAAAQAKIRTYRVILATAKQNARQ